MTQPTQPTRIHIIDADGVSHEFFAKSWNVVQQDQGRTLKAFAVGSPGDAVHARRRRTSSLSDNLAADLDVIRRVADAQRFGK